MVTLLAALALAGPVHTTDWTPSLATGGQLGAVAFGTGIGLFAGGTAVALACQPPECWSHGGEGVLWMGSFLISSAGVVGMHAGAHGQATALRRRGWEVGGPPPYAVALHAAVGLGLVGAGLAVGPSPARDPLLWTGATTLIAVPVWPLAQSIANRTSRKGLFRRVPTAR